MIGLAEMKCRNCGSADLDVRPGLIVCRACGWCPNEWRVTR